MTIKETITAPEPQMLPEAYYRDDELVYSASAYCGRCHAGLAYPPGVGAKSWFCSDVLTGRAESGSEHDAFPFAFWEIKSEAQPSADGRTTRPKS